MLLTEAALSPAAPRTMRIDYYHTGNVQREAFSMDRLVIEPLPWPGNPAGNVDNTNLGAYLFEVHRMKTDELLFSRGFNSIFGEWRTTDEARNAYRTFSESLRFPVPDGPVKVVLKGRMSDGFEPLWSVDVDPKNIFVDDSTPASPGPLIEIQRTGDPASKVDLLILGDGYTEAERPKFEKDARRYMEILFTAAPFKNHRPDFNVWGLCPASAQSGISRPSSGIHLRNPLGTSYDAFGTERYILTYDNRSLRDTASHAPYEFIEILVNGSTYGGGGIYNLYATVAADSMWGSYIFVHEFGHHFAGLADEYYTSEVAYLPSAQRMEPWELNVTALLDPPQLKWKDLMEPDTPVPTPWHKEEFEANEREIQKRRQTIRQQNLPEKDMNDLFQEQKRRQDKLLFSEKHAGKVGAFEGANYQAHGYYRPEVNCIMFTRHDAFCAVCRRAIERVIALYALQGRAGVK